MGRGPLPGIWESEKWEDDQPLGTVLLSRIPEPSEALDWVTLQKARKEDGTSLVVKNPPCRVGDAS